MTGLAPWREDPTLEQVCWRDVWSHGEPMLEWLVRSCSLSPMGETPCWSRGVLSLNRNEQQKYVMNWPQSPFPTLLHLCRGAGRELGIKLSPRRRNIFLRAFFLTFHYSFLICLVVSSINSLSHVCLSCDSNQWMISSCPYPDPGAFNSLSLPCSAWGKGQHAFGRLLTFSQGQTTMHVKLIFMDAKHCHVFLLLVTPVLTLQI